MTRILLGAGSNAKGQLGIGSYDDAHTFTPCQFAGCETGHLPDLVSTVDQIACGANHTVLLLEHFDGSITLWGAGDGRRGQLGPDCRREESPWTIFRELVLPLSTLRGYTYKHIAAAWETTYVVLSRPGSSDVLVSMGSDDFGALGVGGGVDGSMETGLATPRVVDFGHVFKTEAQPRTICIQSLHAGPRHVVVQLVTASSGRSQSVLVGWGASRHGQLGQKGQTRFVALPAILPVNIHEDPMVSCGLGNQHTVVLHSSGRISALGSNKQGQLPSLALMSQKRISKLGCTWNGTYMQATDGDKHVLLSTGNDAQGQLGRSRATESSADDVTVNLAGKRAISDFVCGSEHVLVAILQDNAILGWGWNEHGNMGLGSLSNITIPTLLWPRKDVEGYNKYPQRVVGTWAGCATSWLLVG